ncbi:RNA polymerase sigma factor [Lacihabitans soyangensis]|uniref:RNA polymerase sigma factor n=1 Tax=Lacihabitans soyangensis TaxID=869394 RepID=A0AAE3KUA2_9BACT|nr:RNA polymerase sigma factor [Lacihabitans soyangensis]MCP9764694.1 RNA polymerase sigma factor [Lacihabitans soyangensis]
MALFTLNRENDIIEKIKNNIEINACLKYLYKEYYGFLERMVLNNSGSKEDAEDVIQEVFLAVLQIIQNDKFKGESSLKSFLYAVAKNIWLVKIKKQKAEHKRLNIWIEENPEFDADINDQIKKNEALELISDVLGSLGTVCKDILSRFYYENLSLKEILPFTEFENEQVLRNKKSKCMKALTEKLEQKPFMRESLYKALKIF